MRTRWSKRRQRILEIVGEDAGPEVLVQLRDTITCGCRGSQNARRQHEVPEEKGEGVKVRRSHQAVACRKRYAEEPGKPREAPYCCEGRYTTIEARRGGNLETELCRNLGFTTVVVIMQGIRLLRHEGETRRQDWTRKPGVIA